MIQMSLVWEPWFSRIVIGHHKEVSESILSCYSRWTSVAKTQVTITVSSRPHSSWGLLGHINLNGHLRIHGIPHYVGCIAFPFFCCDYSKNFCMIQYENKYRTINGTYIYSKYSTDRSFFVQYGSVAILLTH